MKPCAQLKHNHILFAIWWHWHIEPKSFSFKIDECFNGEEEIEDSDEEKCLGDIISTDARNMKNKKSWVNKGIGIVNKIMTYLQGIPFVQYYFEVAVF